MKTIYYTFLAVACAQSCAIAQSTTFVTYDFNALSTSASYKNGAVVSQASNVFIGSSFGFDDAAVTQGFYSGWNDTGYIHSSQGIMTSDPKRSDYQPWNRTFAIPGYDHSTVAFDLTFNNSFRGGVNALNVAVSGLPGKYTDPVTGESSPTNYPYLGVYAYWMHQGVQSLNFVGVHQLVDTNGEWQQFQFDFTNPDEMIGAAVPNNAFGQNPELGGKTMRIELFAYGQTGVGFTPSTIHLDNISVIGNIPEPASSLLVLASGGLMLTLRRRRTASL